ncbi:hypothetical protein ABT030_50705 [Streptomyces mirabilis]|uniref:hypothetical protein n=1 Tax=Streptomyces mirabilis TaxID=68239 RepID=UPI003329A12F
MPGLSGRLRPGNASANTAADHITVLVSALLHEKVTLEQAAAALMERPPKPER